MKRLILILLTALLSAAPLLAQYSPCYEAAFAEGQRLFKNGQYTEAKKYFNEAKDCPDPNMDSVNVWIGKCDKMMREANRMIGDLVVFDDGTKGIVFWVDKSGEHGLVVSMDEGHGAFCNLPKGTVIPDNIFINDDGNQYQSLVPGKGAKFTTMLIKAFGSNAVAAKWARNHGKEWYLPSNGELFYLLRTANKRSGPQGPVSLGLSEHGGTTISTRRHGGYLSSSIREDCGKNADLFGFDSDACNYAEWMWYAEGAYRAVRRF